MACYNEKYCYGITQQSYCVHVQSLLPSYLLYVVRLGNAAAVLYALNRTCNQCTVV